MGKEKGYSASQVSSRCRDMELKITLKKLIQEKGITITGLSRTTKVPLQTLHGWLQGSEPKSLRQVKVVADYFGVDLDYLCFGIEPKESSFKDFQDEINAEFSKLYLEE